MNKRTQKVDVLVFLKNLTTWVASFFQQNCFSGLKYLHNGHRVWGEAKQLNLSEFALSITVEVANLIIHLHKPSTMEFAITLKHTSKGKERGMSEPGCLDELQEVHTM